MFLEQRVGQLEERLVQLENADQDEQLERQLAELMDSDLRLHAETALAHQKLEQFEKLALQSKLNQFQSLIRKLENRLASTESHKSKQLGVNKQVDDRVANLEASLEHLPLEELYDQVSDVEKRFSELTKQAQALVARIEGWDKLQLGDRTAQLEDVLGGLNNFRNESQQLGELLRQEIESLSERDDQLFDLLGKFESEIAGLDTKQWQERLNEAETAITGFRAVVKEVRQRFEQSDQKLGEIRNAQNALSGKVEEFSNRVDVLDASVERIQALEEWAESLDLAPLQDRISQFEALVGQLEPLRSRIENVENRVGEIDLIPLGQRIAVVEETAGQFSPFAEDVRNQIDHLAQSANQTQQTVTDHHERLTRCEQFPEPILARLTQLEESNAKQQDLATLVHQLGEKVQSLEVDNRNLREQLKHRPPVQPAVHPVGSSRDWTGRGIAVVGLCAALLLAFIVFQPQPILTAQRFVLQGEDGTVLGEFSPAAAGALLSLRDAQSKESLQIGATAGGPAIRIAAPDGTDRMVLGYRGENGIGIDLMDNRATPRLQLGVQQASHLTLRDTQGERRVVLASLQQGPQLALMHAAENPHVLLGHAALGKGLSIYDSNNRLRVAAGITNDGAAINLFDEAEHRRSVLSANQSGPALAFFGDQDQHRTTIGMSANGESILNLHDASGTQRIVLNVSESDARVNVLDREKNVVFATP